MPVTLDRIQSWLNEWAPPETAEAWDNPGLLVRAGDASAPVTGAVCALDVTPDTIEFAKAHGCSLIVSHHPVISIRISISTGATRPPQRLRRASVC